MFLAVFLFISPTALIEYHLIQCLSITFFIFLHFFQTLLYVVCHAHNAHLYTVYPMCICALLQHCDCIMPTEKEGFEPSRRVTDLHPFQGCPFSLLGTSPKPKSTHLFFRKKKTTYYHISGFA